MKTNNPTCPPRTAVAYARYSSAGQRDVSIEQQLQDIRAYAEREGYRIVHEYADHARSGFKEVTARVEFQAMIAAAVSGSFDTVLCWKVDRFGRNRKDSAVYKDQLARLGVSVVYVMEPIPDGAAGVLTEGMLEAIAEWYSRNIDSCPGLRSRIMWLSDWTECRRMSGKSLSKSILIWFILMDLKMYIRHSFREACHSVRQ